MKAPIIVVEYNSQWPSIFEKEKRLILTAIGNKIIQIEHIGSTAVPGLGAKPIIDIMVGVRKLVEIKDLIKPMIDLGYEYIKEHEKEIPERRFFTKRSKYKGSTHHLHMVEITSEFWRRHLIFRDYLRFNPDTAEKYYKLKKNLETKYRNHREAYTEAKTVFIQLIIERAFSQLSDSAQFILD
ncbi:MAG: GrpB family protein [Promethearchaeota archaeon]